MIVWTNVVIQGILIGGFYALFACGLSLMFGVLEGHQPRPRRHGRRGGLRRGLLDAAPAHARAVVLPRRRAALRAGRLRAPAHADSKEHRPRPFTTLLVTFGLSVVIENLLLEIYSANGQVVNIGGLIAKSWHPTSIIYISYVSLTVLGVAVLVLALLQLFLSRTGPGRLIRAVADDREAAQLSGANYKHVFGIAAAIAFATVALAGIAYGMMTQFAPTSGGVNLLFAFEAVVMGGIGSLWGTLVGGIALGVAQQIGAHINPQYSVLAGNVLFLAVLAIRPQGLFGKKAALA